MASTFEFQPFLTLPQCNQEYQPPVQNENTSLTCQDLYHKIIAVRVYFVIIILNFSFIAITTCCFIYRYLSFGSQKDPSRQWQDYSLRKRGLLGSVLGAIGHFMFSTGVFIYQVVYTSYSCELYLWCPMVGFFLWMYAMLWRTQRLHFLIQTSQLQRRYYYQNDSSSEVFNWFNQHKQAMKKVSTYYSAVLVLSIFLFVVIIVLGETLGLRAPGTNVATKCQFTYGNYVVLGMVSSFFLLIVPFIVWYIRNDEDAHGIRQEIWVTLSVGVPCFIGFIVWQVIFPIPTVLKPFSPRGVFGPINWMVFMTTASHVMSIVFPMTRRLSVTKERKASNAEKRRNTSNTLNAEDYTSTSNCIDSKRKGSIKTIVRPSTHMTAINTQYTKEETTDFDQQLDLTTESLNYALNTPSLLKVLQSWAVKDFTVENILFYDQYLKLVRMIEDRIPDDCNTDAASAIMQESPKEFFSEDAVGPSAAILNTPFEDDEIPKLVSFYDTFIKEQAPLQVNISHRARSLVDAIVSPLSKYKTEANQSKPGIPVFLRQDSITEGHDTEEESVKINIDDHDSINRLVVSNDLHDVQYEEKSRTKSNIQMTPLCQTQKDPKFRTRPTLSVFEETRKEVFWNIFNGLYPKVVEALDHTNP